MGGAEWTFLPASSENLNGFSPPSPRGERDFLLYSKAKQGEGNIKNALKSVISRRAKA